MTTVEVLTSVERRRRWSREEKLRIVAESAQSGRTTSQVARDHGIATGQLFIWRRQLLSEAIANGVVGDGFAAVEIANGRLAAAAPGLAMGALIETAKLNGLDPEAYLHAALGRIADHPINRIAELLPWNIVMGGSLRVAA